MKLFSKNHDKKQPSPREGIYEIAKEAHRKGVEKRMQATTVMTERLIDFYCRSLHRPENLGSISMSAPTVQRITFRMGFDDDNLTMIANSDELDTTIRGVLDFFEKQGFNVTVERFKDSKRIKEAIVSIREADKVV